MAVVFLKALFVNIKTSRANIQDRAFAQVAQELTSLILLLP